MEPVSSAVAAEGQQDWVTALAAIEILASSLGERVAKETLLSLVQRGELQGRADLLLEEADIGMLILDDEHWGWGDERPKSHPMQRDKSRIQLRTDDRPVLTVPTDFFASTDGWVIDPTTVSWPEGVIVARCPATFRPRLNTALLKNRVVVGGASRLGRSKSPPALAESDSYMRRATKGVMFQNRDIQHFASGPPVVPTSAKPSKLPANLDIRADYCAPGDCEPVMDEFQHEIISGQFEAKYNKPRAYGVPAKIGREFESRMMARQLGVPSSATVKRKVTRLLDVFDAHKVKSRSEPS